MGGENETTVAQKKPDAAGTLQVSGEIRYHTSGGEVHFHDDKNRLKVAVPIATWFAAWQKIEAGESWQYIDIERQTSLNVSFATAIDADGKVKLDVCLSIGKIELSDDFEKLRKFTIGSKP